MANCIFCNPDPTALLISNDLGIVVLDDPIRVGHVLVGCHEHAPSLHEVSEESAANTLKLANRVAKIIVRHLGAEKVYVAAIGDKDKHFHVHLLPKMPGDTNLGPSIFGTAGWAASLPKSVDKTELQKLSSVIQADIASVP